MKLHFDPNHHYQYQPIIDLFEGRPLNLVDFAFSISKNSSPIIIKRFELLFGYIIHYASSLRFENKIFRSIVQLVSTHCLRGTK